MSKMSKPPQVAATVFALALASASLAGCGSSEPEQQITEDVYCADKDGNIVDEDLCESDAQRGGSSYFIWYGAYGGSHHPAGHRLNGGNKFPYNDTQGRTMLGLNPTGKVIKGSTGGFGKTVTRSAPGAKGSTGGIGSGKSAPSGG